MDTVPEEKGDKRGKRNKGEEKSGGRRKENGQCLQVDEHDQLPSTKTVEFVQYHILIYIKKKNPEKPFPTILCLLSFYSFTLEA